MKEVNEKSTAWIELSFLDRDGEPITPGTVKYTIYDRSTEQTIREEEFTPPSDSVEITLKSSDNIILDQSNTFEVRVVHITVAFESDKIHEKEYVYRVNNLQFVD